MTAHSPQPFHGDSEGRAGDLSRKSSETVVKETQREGNGTGFTQQPRKETQAPDKAQDVAELKDYV